MILLPNIVIITVPIFCRCKYKLKAYQAATEYRDCGIWYKMYKPCFVHEPYEFSYDKEYSFTERQFVEAYRREIIIIPISEKLKLLRESQHNSGMDLAYLFQDNKSYVGP